MIIRTHHKDSDLVGLYYILDSDIFIYPNSTKLQLNNYRAFSLTAYGSDLIGLYYILKEEIFIYPKNLENNEVESIRELKKEGLEVFEIATIKNALNNNIHIGEKIILINPKLEKKVAKTLSDIFGKEVLPISLNNYVTIGSLIFENKKGFLLGFRAGEENLDKIEKILGKKGYVGSLNGGYSFVKYCIIGNEELGIIGESTTGIEEMKLIDYLEY